RRPALATPLAHGGAMFELETPQDLLQHIGKQLGPSDWMTVDQKMIDKFAEATGDHQWIHVDVERAKKETTLGKGKKRSGGVNYGSNKVPFISPVQAGARIRLRQRLANVEAIPGGVRITSEMTMEIEGQDKTALVAETIGVQYS